MTKGVVRKDGALSSSLLKISFRTAARQWRLSWPGAILNALI
jgi:hypothetical protein